MGRSRSRSRSRERRRDRDRDRDGDKRRDRDRERTGKKSIRSHRDTSRSRSRSRSRSPHRSAKRRSPSPRLDYLTLGNVKPKSISSMPIAKVSDEKPFILDPAQMEGKSAEEIEMMKIMGFVGFDTTKGKHVEDGSANAHAVNIQQKRKYRQYMNRKGGFNKPLDPVA